MDLQLTDEQQAIAQALHEFAENEIRPSARECEEAGQVSERIEKQLLEMGVAAPVPEDLGGQGTFDSLTSVVIAEEVAWGDPGVAFSVLGGGLPATLIDLAGTTEQRQELLPKFLDGVRGSFAIAERDAGLDFTNLDTVAEGSGDKAKLTGLKYAVLNADVAPIRIVAAARDGKPSLWLLAADAQPEAKPEDKLGLRAARTFKVRLESAEATQLGSDDQKVSHALLRAKLLNAGIALGLARAALEYATDYAKERTAFGRPIGAFQGISFKIADRAMEIETAKLMVWRAAWALDTDRDDAHEAIVAGCSHAVAAAVAAADDGVQILGGHGYMRDHPEELWYRDAMTLATLDSPSMIGDIVLAGKFKAGDK